MVSVLDAFKPVNMVYLVVNQGGVYGNSTTEQREIKGIFKIRSGMTDSQNMETGSSSATAHVDPKDFPETLADGQYDPTSLVGNGIMYAGRKYRIQGATGGYNYETNTMEHYTLTLQAEDYVDEGEDESN